MGLSSTKLNCLVLGLEGVGKTTILYGMRLEETNKTFKETVGFNYEVINQVYKGKRFELHMWDLAGKKEVGWCVACMGARVSAPFASGDARCVYVCLCACCSAFGVLEVGVKVERGGGFIQACCVPAGTRKI
jgi:GTPase SAR1 family protein